MPISISTSWASSEGKWPQNGSLYVMSSCNYFGLPKYQIMTVARFIHRTWNVLMTWRPPVFELSPTYMYVVYANVRLRVFISGDRCWSPLFPEWSLGAHWETGQFDEQASFQSFVVIPKHVIYYKRQRKIIGYSSISQQMSIVVFLYVCLCVKRTAVRIVGGFDSHQWSGSV